MPEQRTIEFDIDTNALNELMFCSGRLCHVGVEAQQGTGSQSNNWTIKLTLTMLTDKTEPL